MKDYIVLILIFAVAFLFMAIRVFRKPKQTYYQNLAGEQGEKKVNYIIKGCLNKGSYYLSNCYLPRKNSTSEVDGIILCPQGIFVVETKNYSGIIYGNDTDEKWIQVRTYGANKGEKKLVSNSVHQNKIHKLSLTDLIGKGYPIYSLIIFDDKCDISKLDVQSEDVYLINSSGIRTQMRLIYQASPVLNQATLNKLYKILLPTTNVSANVKKQHIADIKKEHKN